MSGLSLERYDKDAVRVMVGESVVGMLLRHCDDMWSINDAREQPLTKRRLRSAYRAFTYALEHGLYGPTARDRDGSGEAGQTAKQAGPEGREPGPAEEQASPKSHPEHPQHNQE